MKKVKKSNNLSKINIGLEAVLARNIAPRRTFAEQSGDIQTTGSSFNSNINSSTIRRGVRTTKFLHERNSTKSRDPSSSAQHKNIALEATSLSRLLSGIRE